MAEILPIRPWRYNPELTVQIEELTSPLFDVVSEKQRKALYDFDEEELRPYFSLNNVMDGLFETAKRLYHVSIVPNSALPTWHKGASPLPPLDHTPF